MATALPALAFLGVGSMAGAIVSGVLARHGNLAAPIRLTTRSTESAARWQSVPGVEVTATEANPEANRDAVRDAGVVVIAVKPAAVPALLDDIAGAIRPDAVVVSVAAGVTIAAMKEQLPESIAVVRTMPNTPAAVGRAVTGIAVGPGVSEAQRAAVIELFSAVGATIVLDEERIDALSTISGSGPAYVFYLIEQFEAAARELGFSADDAAVMVRETFSGSLELLAAGGASPAELRRAVTSPNGTTERAIAVFDEANLAAVFRRATDAALARAREIAQANAPERKS